MSKYDKLSIYMSRLLRHKPEEAHLSMDIHGYVNVDDLIEGINRYSKYSIDLEILKHIVETDQKGRYRFSEDGTKIKACQGHSLDWVIPTLKFVEVPDILYHGTTKNALLKIKECGYVSKMKRHAVHMSADLQLAKKSASRWKHQEPIVLVIDSKRMVLDGLQIGVTENDVWCIEQVDIKYIVEELE